MADTDEGRLARWGRTAVALALRFRLTRAALRYSEPPGPGLADGITYRALFSVFAAVLLGCSLAALWLGGDPEAMGALADALERVIPGLTDVVDPSAVGAPVAFTLVGAVSLFGLIGAAIGAVASLRTAIRVIAGEVHDDGFFLWVLARNLLVAVSFGVLLALAAALSVIGGLGVERVAAWLGLSAPAAVAAATRAVSIAVVFALDTAAIALVFRVLSGVPVSTRGLLRGSAIGGAGLIVLQELSGLFVRGAAANPLLASFAALITLLLWFNLSSQVILYASSYLIVTAEEEAAVTAGDGAPGTGASVTTLAEYRRMRATARLRAAERELRNAEAAARAGWG